MVNVIPTIKIFKKGDKQSPPMREDSFDLIQLN